MKELEKFYDTEGIARQSIAINNIAIAINNIAEAIQNSNSPTKDLPPLPKKEESINPNNTVLVQRIIDAIPFPVEVDFGIPDSKGRQGGFIKSFKFENMDQVNRQDIIWTSLSNNLLKEYRRKITHIVTVTPLEYEE